MRKITEIPCEYDPGVILCMDPEHDPPKHVHLEPGLYVHECPRCGKKQYVTKK